MSQSTKTTSTLHRYTPYAYVEEESGHHYACVEMERELGGEWVRWEDVEKLINEMRSPS